MARTEAQRENALRLYSQEGLAAASRATGIPKPTLVRWADAAGMERNAERSAEQHRQAAAVSVASMAERRTRLAEQLLTIAEQRAAVVQAAEPERDSRHVMTVAAIAIDKSQLLAGEPTARTETIAPEQARSELVDLQRQWRDRRAS